jgi:hypothetical protein
MADVVASVTAVLSQTSLQVALQAPVSGVLQRHLQDMAGRARQQLLPSPDDDDREQALPSTQVRRARAGGPGRCAGAARGCGMA